MPLAMVPLALLGAARKMKGSKCKCGYATVAIKTKCPRCGREMSPSEWPDEGRVLSFTPLQAIPEGLENPCNLALVEIVDDGPKVVCWTSGKLNENDEVSISEWSGKYICAPKPGLEFALKQPPSKSD